MNLAPFFQDFLHLALNGNWPSAWWARPVVRAQSVQRTLKNDDHALYMKRYEIIIAVDVFRRGVPKQK